LAARLTVAPFDENVAIQFGQVRAELAKEGTPIGPYEQMIAGHACALSLILVTIYAREFKRVAGLCIENWV
jgi:tRNA(fMet)-specific endonuclease VapC